MSVEFEVVDFAAGLFFFFVSTLSVHGNLKLTSNPNHHTCSS